MLVCIILVLYVILHIYAAYEIYKWLISLGGFFEKRGVKLALIAAYAALALVIIIAFFLPQQWELKKLLSRIGNYYEGIFINTLLVIVAAHLVSLILKLVRVIPKDYFHKGVPRRVSGLICLATVAGFSAYGFINAHYIQTTQYDVTVDKPIEGESKDMKIVLVSDLHLGYNLGYKNVEQMVDKINALKPDLVCMAGDTFDNNYDALDDEERIEAAFRAINSTYGTYACWGNHGISDKLLMGFTVNNNEEKTHDVRMSQLFENSGIHLLEDEAEVVDNKFTIIGRLDYHKPGTPDNTRLSIEDFSFDTSMPVIVLDHEPKELQELADAGVDMDLCGHTHNGQIFPMTLTSKLIWENSAGYLQKIGKSGNIMHNYVTEGVGAYGPFMRTGCKSEIVCINVHFK